MKSLNIFLTILLAGALSNVYAEPVERIFIEYAPGSRAMLQDAVEAEGGQVHYQFDRIDAMAVTISTAIADRLAKHPNVISIEPDARRYLAADPVPSADPSVEQLLPYGIERVQAPLVWDAGYDGEGVTVCIIDTGLYYEHEDLVGIDVVNGESQDPDSDWYQDGYGHGTHVAGTVNAVDNDVGVIGVSPGKAALYAVKIFGEDGLWTNSSDLMAAAFSCAENGAKVINMSLSGSSGPGAERKAFDVLYHEDGILSVAAASNDGSRKRVFPASYDSVISVAATDPDNVVADFSNQNKWVELAAPGVFVLSTVSYVSDSWLEVGDGAEKFQGEPMEFTPYSSETGLLADGGLCSDSGDWSGKVVLCERGDIDFADKVTAVKNGGGIAAVIYNNEPGNFFGTMGEEGDWIPAISVSREDGQLALAYLEQLATVNNGPPIPGSSYEAWGGTSMATPHVAGVAALLWSANPDWTNVQIREAMDQTALDLGDPGRDIAYGYGLVQAYDALQYLFDMGTGKGPGPEKH